MNVVQGEFWAFIFPDNMEDFRKRYGADVIAVDLEEGSLAVIGPNDRDWREIPSDVESGLKVVKLRSKD